MKEKLILEGVFQKFDTRNRNRGRCYYTEEEYDVHIKELEQKFSMNVDKAFLELDIGQQCVVVNRTKDYFNKLAEIVIPDKDKRQNIICNNKIFDPGYDEFSFYLLQQYMGFYYREYISKLQAFVFLFLLRQKLREQQHQQCLCHKIS